MKNNILHKRILVCTLGVLLMAVGIQSAHAQQLRRMVVGQLQSYFMDYGAETESTPFNTNFFAWPSQYGDDQYTARSRALWMGALQFNDPVEKKLKSVKVIGVGPRWDAVAQPTMIFPQSIKLIGKSAPPSVLVDNTIGSSNVLYDVLDEVRPSLPCDRMIEIKFNTSMGVSVTKRIMAFTQVNHDNYFVIEYTFTNTGIYNNDGAVLKQTLNNFYAYLIYRDALAGVTTSGYGSTWGAFTSLWAVANYYDFGNPYRPQVTSGGVTDNLRGYYSYYTPNKDRTGISYAQDWGCPNQNGGGVGVDGVLGSAMYSGAATLFAAKSATDWTDDPTQPHTTAYENSDDIITQLPTSQYDELFMQKRYAWMSEGHLPKSMKEDVGNLYVGDYYSSHQSGRYGGTQGQGYGPYTLAPGDSIRIVIADGVNGLSWERCRSVGANWYAYYYGLSSPALVMPNGSTSSSYTDYTRAWVETGADSIIHTLRAAVANYKAGYQLPQAPPAPAKFTVSSGGDRISLTWTGNAYGTPHFGGYVIYRSEGTVKNYKTVYAKVFECGNANITSFDDTSAVRGFKYYYYIQSKDDGTQADVDGVKRTQYSSLFMTLTSVPAYLLRPSGTKLEEVRVVPNPYDIRSRKWQFGDVSQLDQISFYGLPPRCTLKIYTENGTKIWEKAHTNGAGDESWDSKTSSGQIVVSGIYILYVEVSDDATAATGEKIFTAGQSIIRKFVVIR